MGPILFSLYTSPLNKIISAYTLVKFHIYADDTQLYVHLSSKNTSVAISQLQSCLKDVQAWMGTNKLKFNPDKTEFILFGSKSQRKKLANYFPIDILGSQLSPTNVVRNLGVYFDSGFNFSNHVSAVCKASFVCLRDFRRTRRHLTKSTAVMLQMHWWVVG